MPDSIGSFGAGLAQATMFSFMAFLPWAVCTRPLLAFCARLVPRPGKIVRNLVLLAAAGIPITALISAAGALLARAGLGLFGSMGWHAAFARVPNAILATSLYSLPTYVAVIAIGQALAWAGRHEQQERLALLAREEALRAQLQPHFLFNALNAIAELGHGQPDRADKALVGLGALLQRTLDVAPTTTLAEEAATAADLVAIHQALHSADLLFEIQLADQVASAEVPALILQPLVENALLHGVATRRAGGVVALRAWRSAHALCIELTNPLSDHPNVSGRGIGVDHVRGRLQALFGADGAIEVSERDGVFVVALSMPYLRGKAAP